MKRPALILSTLLVAICSAVLVSTTISGIAKSFYKNDTENVNAKIDANNNDLKQVNAKL